MSIITVKNLTKNYPSSESANEIFTAVDNINLNIEKGEIFGLLGPNGAGKTSTLEMLEGLNKIDGGSVEIDSINVESSPYAVKKIIGVQLQSSEYFDRLNLSDLINLFATLYSASVEPRGLLAKFNLEHKILAKPDELSGGQRQRFSIACALVHNPKILFLDEPTTGLDPQAKRNIWKIVKTLNQAGMTIVLTTHNMEEAEYLCDRIAIMDEGSVIAQDTPKQLIKDYENNIPERTSRGNLEDVFLSLAGHELRET